MNDLIATFPTKLYVTLQYRSTASNGDGGHMGFASPYTKDSAFAKRKITQDTWAYGTGTITEITADEKVLITHVPEGAKWDKASLFMTNAYPKIIDNELLSGFEVAKNIRRSGYSGSSNVLWCITDPRGFDLEITSENFAAIVSSVDMKNGVINERCIWARTNGKNVLIPESSDPYQSTKLLTDRTNTRVSLRDVTPGDTVDILADYKLNEKCVFFGRYHFLTGFTNLDVPKTVDRIVNLTKFNSSQQIMFVFKSLATGKYFLEKSPKISSIIEKAVTPIDTSLAAGQLMQSSGDLLNGIFGTYDRRILCSNKKIDLSKITATLIPITDTATLLSNSSSIHIYQGLPTIAKYKNDTYIAFPKVSQSASTGLTLYPVKLSSDNLVIHWNRSPVYSGSRFGYGRDYDTTVSIGVSDPTLVEFYSIEVEYEGLRAIVHCF